MAGVTAIETRIGAVPVPLNVTFCGLEVPLSVTVRVPDRLPKALGENVIEMVQVAAGARVAGLTGQLLAAAKSDKLVEMLAMVMAEVWPFFKATVWMELVVPSA